MIEPGTGKRVAHLKHVTHLAIAITCVASSLEYTFDKVLHLKSMRMPYMNICASVYAYMALTKQDWIGTAPQMRGDVLQTNNVKQLLGRCRARTARYQASVLPNPKNKNSRNPKPNNVQ